MAKYSKEDVSSAREMLRKFLRPGDTVYTVLRHCSRSGMTRHIDLYKLEKNDRIYLSGYAATVMGDSRSRDGAIVVGGCGMDMGFHLVYNLGRTLFPKGFKLRKGQRGRNGDTSGFDNDGGYALNHRWL